MVSFQQKFAAGMERLGIHVCYDLEDWPYQAVLVIGGTRQLAGLWRARRRGARIVQRLDGMNWLHRVKRTSKGQSTSLHTILRSEYGNLVLAFIRRQIAQRVVYQSEFAHKWWERTQGVLGIPSDVVYNGVDLNEYSPQGAGKPPAGRYRILLVEGSLMGGYEAGLEAAVGLAERIQTDFSRERPGQVELMVVGRVQPEVKQRWEQGVNVQLIWTGLVPPERIPEIDRSAHLLYSADVNAACPNSVIEALACGLPVVAFDTGALSELVSEEAGRIVSYGGDPWRLDPPDINGLTWAAMELFGDLERFRYGARERAEKLFSLERMVEGYLQVLLDV